MRITAHEYAWITAAFQVTIMLQPLCGYRLDVIGLKRGFALFALAWSLISMAHGLARSWQAFAFLRGLLGLAEGSANPAGMKATAEWSPAAPGMPNLTGAFVGMACHDLAGTALPADFDRFEYREREYLPDPRS